MDEVCLECCNVSNKQTGTLTCVSLCSVIERSPPNCVEFCKTGWCCATPMCCQLRCGAVHYTNVTILPLCTGAVPFRQLLLHICYVGSLIHVHRRFHSTNKAPFLFSYSECQSTTSLSSATELSENTQIHCKIRCVT